VRWVEDELFDHTKTRPVEEVAHLSFGWDAPSEVAFRGGKEFVHCLKGCKDSQGPRILFTEYVSVASVHKQVGYFPRKRKSVRDTSWHLSFLEKVVVRSLDGILQILSLKRNRLICPVFLVLFRVFRGSSVGRAPRC
jgi:hypothetical protein